MRRELWIGAIILAGFILSFTGRGYWLPVEEPHRLESKVSAAEEQVSAAGEQKEQTRGEEAEGPCFGERRPAPRRSSSPRSAARPQSKSICRIISLAPSITETLFTLGLGDRVVGVSRFCDWPPEVQTRPKVGGLFDPNLEAMVRLEPDLILGLAGQPDTLLPIQKLGLPLAVVDHRSIEGVLDSIRIIGQLCDVQQEAGRLLKDIQTRLAEVHRRVARLPRPRVLVVVQRSVGAGKIENIYIAGREGHLGRIVQLAGGENAAPKAWAAFPIVSVETILRLDPDVILDLVPGFCTASISRQQILADWQSIEDLRAVRQGRVYLLDEDFVFRPGPRFILLVEKLARLFHPTVFATERDSERK